MSDERRLPYIPLYPDDLLSHLFRSGESTLALGARVLLWCQSAHETPVGTLPDDPDTLARMAHLTPEEWSQVGPQLTASWDHSNRLHRFCIRRIMASASRLHKTHHAKSIAARAGWEKRRNKLDGAPMQADAPLHDIHKPSQAKPSQANTTHTREKSGVAGGPATSAGGGADRQERAEKAAAVVAHYCKRFGRKFYTLTETRRRILDEACRCYSLEVLTTAIDVFADHPAFAWHRGSNPSGKRWDGLCEYILAKGVKCGVEARVEDVLRQGGVDLEEAE